MTDMFNASEVFQFAIRIEENGGKYYRHFSKTLVDSEIKNVFSQLADEEIAHKRIFEEMVSKIEKYEPPESYPGEYFAYLRAYADNIVFDQKKLEKELSEIKDAIAAVEFGIRREVDAILYYLEMRNNVAVDHQKEILKIVEEERRHFLKLTELKKKLRNLKR